MILPNILTKELLAAIVLFIQPSQPVFRKRSQSGLGLKKTIKIWEVATERELRTLTGHSDVVRSVVYSPDGRYLASGSDDDTLTIWEVATGNELRTLTGHSETVFSVAYSPDGRYLASGSGDKTIKIWRVRQ